MKAAIGLLIILLASVAHSQGKKECFFNNEKKEYFDPHKEMLALPEDKRLEYYKRYVEDIKNKKVELVVCPEGKAGFTKMSAPTGDKEIKNKDCYIALTGKPYCVSKYNARQFCNSVDPDEKALGMVKSCIQKNLAPGLPPFIIHTTCLGMGSTTGDPTDDSSNCSASGAAKGFTVDS